MNFVGARKQNTRWTGSQVHIHNKIHYGVTCITAEHLTICNFALKPYGSIHDHSFKFDIDEIAVCNFEACFLT